MLDKEELLDGIKKGNSSSKSFLTYVDECVSERESKAFWKGFFLKFRSGTHGLNEELGRHRGREGKVECSICWAECESVVHVL